MLIQLIITNFTLISLLPASSASADGINSDTSTACLKSRGHEYSGSKLQAYVDSIGASLQRGAFSGGPEIEIAILNDGGVQAYATFDGRVFLTRGLLAFANDEAEVAAVISHEIAHIRAGHTTALESVGIELERAIKRGVPEHKVSSVADCFPNSTELQAAIDERNHSADEARRFAHQKETEADRLAIQYLVDSHYDPRALSSFLRRADAMTELKYRWQKKPEVKSGWFDTHPPTGLRIQVMDQRAKALANERLRRGRQTHLNAINGLLWGDDPSLGYHAGYDFIYPRLNVAFEFPKGFTVTETSHGRFCGRRGFDRSFCINEVTGDNLNELERLLGSEYYESLPTDSKGQTAKFSLHGKPAVIRHVTADGNKINEHRLIAIIQLPERRAISAHFVHHDDQSEMSDAELNNYRKTIESVRPLTSEDRAPRPSSQLEIIRVDTEQSVFDWAARRVIFGIAKRRMLVMNDLGEDAVLEAGQILKLVGKPRNSDK